MKTAWIVILVIALFVSNAWWMYHAVDTGYTVAYRDDSLSAHHEALAQALAILPVAARPDSTRAQVIGAARAASRSGTEPFETEGFLWVGRIGLKFSESGRVIEASPAWKPF